MDLATIIKTIILPALAMLPPKMNSFQARVMLLSIGLQESHFQYRRQLGNGPARGFWQFEMGTQASRGGIWGVFLHPQSAPLLKLLCESQGVGFDPKSIWTALETNDIFACCVARLMLWTDAAPLPAAQDPDGTWALYLRVWNPGKPRPAEWPNNHQQALQAAKDQA